MDLTKSRCQVHVCMYVHFQFCQYTQKIMFACTSNFKNMLLVWQNKSCINLKLVYLTSFRTACFEEHKYASVS